jgi:hypothetical protein
VSDQGAGYPQDQPAQQWQPAPPQHQQPYGSPAYGPPGADQVRFHAAGPLVEHPQATLAFVLGLLSVIGLTILGPFGWYYGNKVVGEIDRDPREFGNRGIAMAGKVLGIIGTVFLALTVALMFGAIIFAVVASSKS